MKAVVVIASFLLVSFIYIGCDPAYSGQPEPALATVDGEAITVADFRDGYIDYLLQTSLQDEYSHRLHYLNARIAARLLAGEARQNGLDTTAAYAAALAKMEKKLMVDVYLQKTLFDTLQIREDELKDMFVRANTTLTARHLYARTPEEANRLYRRLNQGESFEALAREVFADTALANNGGLVGTFTLDEMDLAFEEAAYALQIGEISSPVQTRQGYSIIQLLNRTVKPLITEYEFAEKRDRMEHFVTYRKKTAARTHFTRDFIEALSFEFYEPAMERILDQIAGTTVRQQPENAGMMDDEPLVGFIAGGDKQTWDVHHFKLIAAETSVEQRERVVDRSTLERFVSGLVMREEMIRRANALGYNTLPDVERVRARAERDWLWDEATTDLYLEVVVPADTIQSHFEAFQGSYQEPERVRISEILVGTKKEAVEIKQKLSNHTFEMLAKQYSIRPGAKAYAGDLGYLSSDQLGVLSKTVWPAKEGAVIGPLEFKGHYALLKVGERKPARPLSFEEAKPEIEQRLEPVFRKRKLQTHIGALKAKSRVEIYEKRLAAFVLNG